MPTPTPSQLSIAIPVLQQKRYMSTPLTKVQNITPSGNFTSEIISYTVDSLTEYALVDIPATTKPHDGFPVVMLDHGYIIPSEYNTVVSYEEVADFFASHGYIVLKPDYRGNGTSQGADDPLQRFNYPTDVLTLLVSLKNIPFANPSKIYFWGHSMGGEVTLEVLEILGKQKSLAKDVRAAALWAPVNDPIAWFSEPHIQQIPEAQLTPFPYTQTLQILGQPSENSPIWKSISPMTYLTDITTPIQLSHGTSDTTVPYSWSIALQDRLQVLHKDISFVSYPGADHNLDPDSTQALINTLQFFRNHE